MTHEYDDEQHMVMICWMPHGWICWELKKNWD